MGDSNESSQKLEESAAVELTGRIMVVAMIVLFVVIAFVVFLHLYAKWYWRHVAQAGGTTITGRRRQRMDVAGGHHQVTAATAALRGQGLDPSFLKTIPIILFSTEDFKDGLECSVCLSEVTQGEKTRLLPKCNHGFHVQCIDMWFQSHSTCPICRNPVLDSNSDQLSQQGITHNTPEAADYSFNAVATAVTTEALSFPTNVLYWGNEVQVSTLPSCLQDDNDDDDDVTSSQQLSSSSSSSPTSARTTSNDNMGDGHYLVIEIPRLQTNEEEDHKSPVLSRLRSLKRLLSRDRKINPFTPSSSVDVEQAARSPNN